MHGLTKKQRDFLHFIQQFMEENQIAPTYREISKHFGYSSLGSVYKHLQTLERKGYLTKGKTARSLHIPQDENPSSERCIQIPYIGFVRAGHPLETLSKTENLSLPASWVTSSEATYLLKVKGDGFHDEHIQAGDFLIVEARQEVEVGEMVLVLINTHEAYLKRYFPIGDFVRLEASNPSYRPIIVRRESISIQGLFLGLFRL